LKEILIHLLSIMDLQTTTGFSKLFLSDSAGYFSAQGINKYQFVRATLKLVKDIHMCRMMRKTQETPDEKPAFDLDRFKK